MLSKLEYLFSRRSRFKLSGIPSNFDPDLYFACNPDVRDAGVDPYRHWLEHGRFENRIYSAPPIHLIGKTADFEPGLKTLLVVGHEASRTGAPILCLNVIKRLKADYNIVTFLLNGQGGLRDEFAKESKVLAYMDGYGFAAMKFVLPKLLAKVRPDLALVNSVVSHSTLPVLARASIPAVSLIHEFASYVHPISGMEDMVRYSSALVFSAPIVKNDAQFRLPNWTPNDETHLLPQGLCATAGKDDPERVRAALRPKGWPQDAKIVLGAGSVNLRKGVDLFIQCAQYICARSPGEHIRFIWVGHGYDPEKDMVYSTYLSEHVRRGGLTANLEFIGELESLETAYREADVLLLTSRLDPLPNVGIDAVCKGLPILCFEHGSGIADILTEEGLKDNCVAPYLDTVGMAEMALRILRDDVYKGELASKLTDIGRTRFDMDRYVLALKNILERAHHNQVG